MSRREEEQEKAKARIAAITTTPPTTPTTIGHQSDAGALGVEGKLNNTVIPPPTPLSQLQDAVDEKEVVERLVVQLPVLQELLLVSKVAHCGDDVA